MKRRYWRLSENKLNYCASVKFIYESVHHWCHSGIPHVVSRKSVDAHPVTCGPSPIGGMTGGYPKGEMAERQRRSVLVPFAEPRLVKKEPRLPVIRSSRLLLRREDKVVGLHILFVIVFIHRIILTVFLCSDNLKVRYA